MQPHMAFKFQYSLFALKVTKLFFTLVITFTKLSNFTENHWFYQDQILLVCKIWKIASAVTKEFPKATVPAVKDCGLPAIPLDLTQLFCPDFTLAAGPPSGFTTDGVSCWGGEPFRQPAISLHLHHVSLVR
jgi:hypothetical protein